MEALNLPVPKKGDMPEPKVLSMHDYVQFVNMNMLHLLDHKAYRLRKQKEVVHVLFRLKQ